MVRISASISTERSGRGFRRRTRSSKQTAPVATAAHEAPAAAFAAAQQAGAAGQGLATAARDAFMAGSRAAMLIGMALLLVGAVYVALRGNHATADEPAVDDVHDEADEAALAVPLEAAATEGHG